jgi:hypothetical protein
MKTYWGVEVQLHTFLTLALDGVSGQIHTQATLPQEKSRRYPLGKRLGGPQSLDAVVKRKIPSPLPGSLQNIIFKIKFKKI